MDYGRACGCAASLLGTVVRTIGGSTGYRPCVVYSAGRLRRHNHIVHRCRPLLPMPRISNSRYQDISQSSAIGSGSYHVATEADNPQQPQRPKAKQQPSRVRSERTREPAELKGPLGELIAEIRTLTTNLHSHLPTPEILQSWDRDCLRMIVETARSVDGLYPLHGHLYGSVSSTQMAFSTAIKNGPCLRN